MKILVFERLSTSHWSSNLLESLDKILVLVGEDTFISIVNACVLRHKDWCNWGSCFRATLNLDFGPGVTLSHLVKLFFIGKLCQRALFNALDKFGFTDLVMIIILKDWYIFQRRFLWLQNHYWLTLIELHHPKHYFSLCLYFLLKMMDLKIFEWHHQYYNLSKNERHDNWREVRDL